MLPPAPPRLSTMAVWPVMSDRRVVTKRVVASLPPPAGKGDTNLMAWLGKPPTWGMGCADAAPCAASRAQQSEAAVNFSWASMRAPEWMDAKNKEEKRD